MNIRSQIRHYINHNMIENNPVIVSEMLRSNRLNGRKANNIDRAVFVISLYVKYALLHKDPVREFEKALYRLPLSETYQTDQISLEQIRESAKDLSEVVFDAWNVLFYPALDLYQLKTFIENETGSPGVSEYEQDINAVLQSINAEQTGKEVISDFTLDNAPMHELWNGFLQERKRLLVYNNTPFDDQLIYSVMEKYGYSGKIVHCVSEESKHITTQPSNPNDIFYRDVNRLGNRYRPYYERNVITELAGSVMNLQLHNTDAVFSNFYEYGLTCGGILTCGFCDWLNQLADRKNIDLFLFVARDGEIMQKIYERYYGKRQSDYLVFSRFASFELIFSDYPEEYIDKNIKPRIGRRDADNTIGNILRECGLEFILKDLPQEVLTEHDVLTMDNYENFRRWILCCRKKMELHFEESCKSAEQYYRRICRDHHNICIVDLGWHGKSIIYLKHFMEEKCRMNVAISGAMIGAANDPVTQNYIRKDIIETYAFEDERWRSCGTHNGKRMGYEETICVEALFSSKTDTLLRYQLDGSGQTDFVYGRKNRNQSAIEEIHKGIEDFAKQFAPIQSKYGLRVMPRDAYTPLYHRMQNRKFRKWIYTNYHEEAGAINGF